MKDERVLLKLINETKEKILENNMKGLMTEFEKITNVKDENIFTVAVVGEFSRGKSTIINKLIGSELLPVGNLPTTAILTKILYSEESTFTYIDEEGVAEELKYEEDLWDKFVVDDSTEVNSGHIKIGLPIQWLKDSEIMFIDTPGAGDLSDKRTAIVRDSIVQCDSAIIAISATNALSMTEEAFIEEYLIMKRVPHIIIILTRLDQVEQKDRPSVIEYVKAKVSLLNKGLKTFIIQDAKELGISEYSNMTGIDNIKEEILKWVKDSDHEQLKIVQTCAQLQYILNIVKDVLLKEKYLETLSIEEKFQLIKNAEMDIKNRSLLWEEYRVEMLNRSNKCAQWISKKVYENKNSLLETLQLSLVNSDNPKYWWSNNLHYLLKKELLELAKGMEKELEEIFYSDISWLNNIVESKFSSNVLLDNKIELKNKVCFLEDTVENNKDMNKIRTYVRIGIAPVTIIGYTLFGPFGALITLGAGVASEVLLDNNIDKEREEFNKLLIEVVNKNLKEIVKECEKRIHEIYDRAVIEVSRKERIWLKEESEKLQNAKTDVKVHESNFNEKIYGIEELMDSINRFMEV